MLIKWLGHACFKVEDLGESVVFDPFEPGSVSGIEDIDEEANMVLCSHMHGDHCYAKGVKLLPMEHDHFEISYIESYHDDKKGKQRGPNTIHLIESEGFRFCHMGDIGCDLTDEQYDQLTNIHVLMIPVGGTFTVSPKKAAEIAKKIHPKVIIPMHYKGDNFGYDILAPVTEFTKYFENVVWLTTNTFEFSDEFDGDVVVLEYVPKQAA